MSKKKKPEVRKVRDAATAPASVETEIRKVEHHSDRPLPRKSTGKAKAQSTRSRHSRRTRRARDRLRRRSHGRARASLNGRRAATHSVVSASHHTAKDTPVEVSRDSLMADMPIEDEVSRDSLTESEASWHSLTAAFFACNEKSIEGTIGKGHVILRGKDKDHGGRPHGQFTPWLVEDLGLGAPKTALWKAEIYMQIALHRVISDRKYWRKLPPSYRCLYELSQIRPDEKLVEYIEEGIVHSDMRRREAEELKRESLDKPPKGTTSDKPPKSTALPAPPCPEALAVLEDLLLKLRAKNLVIADIRKHPRPSQPLSDNKIDDAVRWIKDQIAKMRGE